MISIVNKKIFYIALKTIGFLLILSIIPDYPPKPIRIALLILGLALSVVADVMMVKLTKRVAFMQFCYFLLLLFLFLICTSITNRLALFALLIFGLFLIEKCNKSKQHNKEL